MACMSVDSTWSALQPPVTARCTSVSDSAVYRCREWRSRPVTLPVRVATAADDACSFFPSRKSEMTCDLSARSAGVWIDPVTTASYHSATDRAGCSARPLSIHQGSSTGASAASPAPSRRPTAAFRPSLDLPFDV
eukprot:3031189-Prymnesium_polylepis.3